MTWDASKSPGDLITSSDWNDMVTDQKGHSSRHSDGGGDELDAADLAGGLGTSGQVLQTDGSAASWTDLETVNTISSDYTTSGETTILIGQTLTRYSLSSASYTGTSISTQDSGPTGLAFNGDGTKMFEIGEDSDLIYEYSLSTAYDITTATFQDSISTQDNLPAGLAFNGDGTKMFEAGNGSELIYEYSLSTAYDISTATFQDSISAQDSSPQGLAFNSDGTKMFEAGGSSDLIYEYSLSTAYDISTATFQDSISAQDSFPTGIAFNSDGTKMFEIGSGSDLIYEYSLSTAYDISTATFQDSISTQDGGPAGLAFNGDGTKMFEIGSGSDLIYEYTSSDSTSVSLSSTDAGSSGKIVRVVDTTGSAGSNSVTIGTEGSELINGESSATLNSDFEGLTFQSDGSDWYIVSRMDGGSI